MNMYPSVNYERFPTEYFAGSDIRIYFEDTFIDEVTDLQFSMKINVLPINGYNSYTFDKIARGSRIVQGMFAINFKRVDYLTQAIEEAKTGQYMEDWKDNFPESDTLISQGDKPTDQENINKLYAYAEKGITTLYDDSKFEQMASDLEAKIWGNSQEDNNVLDRDRTYFPNETNSFDIMITYGAYKRPRLNSIEQPERDYLNNINSGTVKSINNVQITGLAQTIDNSGKPVKEVYTFLARDLDKN